jgi:hypothetical protein
MKVALASSVVCAPGAQSLAQSGVDSLAVGNDSSPSSPAPTVISPRRNIYRSMRSRRTRGEIMSRIKGIILAAAGLSIRSAALLALGFVLFAQQPGQAQAPAQRPLSFFKNYFITGDYIVRGASLWRKGNAEGKATADIKVSGFPNGVDVLAAFLYVQTAERVQWSGIDHAKFNGYDLGPGNNSFAKALNWDLVTPPCWSVAVPGGRRMVTYRADVLRFLPIDNAGDAVTNPNFGKQAVNGLHRVVVPDVGPIFGDDDETAIERLNNPGARAVGTSLVVVYRDPNQPFKAIVLYDGGYTKRALAKFEQPLRGFYEASKSPMAKMTHIVGDGRPLLSELVTLGANLFVNPYNSADGAKWDNPTFNLPKYLGGEEPPAGLTLTVDRLGLLPDCVSFSAVIFSTNVQDADGDGLVDAWERNTNNNLKDPNNQPLPNLADMGAQVNHKDLFVQIDYMKTLGDTTYGAGNLATTKPEHSHLPTLSALQMMGKAFKTAPVLNPDGTFGINVHFDVGSNYQTNPPDPHIIPATAVKERDAIDEHVTVCPRDPDDPRVCQFSDYPGTVGWKTGYRFLRDEFVNRNFIPPPSDPDAADPCEDLGSGCERRFDDNRKDTFHYALFAHSLGLPKDSCQDSDPVTNAKCQQYPSDFHVPRTNSGIGDFPGADLLVTLGAFEGSNALPIGTDFMQGATLMHELGHNFELTHAGRPLIPRAPNCNPIYLSTMNYMYQLRGLLDASSQTFMDYNRRPLAGFNEIGVNDGILGNLGTGTLPYKIGWYAPKNTSYLKATGTAATKHCDGSPISAAEQFELDKFGGMVRVDGVSPEIAKLDWNANGAKDFNLIQDLNFNGTTIPIISVTDDWANVHLSQLGGRRNVGGLFTNKTTGRPAVGPLSLDVGHGDIGHGDIGHGDIGHGDIGHGDIGHGDIGHGDIGHGDIGHGDIGHGDIGRGYLGLGDLSVSAPNEATFELDLETARAVEGDRPTPPSGLVACLTNGEGGCAAPGSVGDRPVRLNWQAPHLAQAVRYFVYRFGFAGETFEAPATLPTLAIDVVDAPSGGVLPTTYLDFTAPPDANLAYFVRAQFADLTLSGISNFATIRTPSAPDLGWVATNSDNCTTGSPQIVFAGNSVTMGVFDSVDAPGQPECVHGVSALLPPLAPGNTRYQVTFTYSLYSWDSYNAPAVSGNGYFDSFSVSVSTQPYASLTRLDPITTGEDGGKLTGLGFIWGGTNYLDTRLECNPSTDSPLTFGCSSTLPAAQATVNIPGNTGGNNNSYLNVVLDTITTPDHDLAHPSYGTIKILSVVQVP